MYLIDSGGQVVRVPRVFPWWAWLIVVPCAFIVIYGVYVEFTRQRVTEGGCPNCHYDLTGNVSGVCPECGTPIKPDGQEITERKE